MKKQKKGLYLTIFAILTTATILVWITVEAWLKLSKTNVEAIPPKVLKPLNPTLDTKTLDSIEQKQYFDANTVQALLKNQQAQTSNEQEQPDNQEPTQ